MDRRVFDLLIEGRMGLLNVEELSWVGRRVVQVSRQRREGVYMPIFSTGYLTLSTNTRNESIGEWRNL